MMKLRLSPLGLCLASVTLAALLQRDACGEVKLASPFTDHAILQREMLIPIWGTSDPNAEVRVEFGGQSKTTLADADGKWRVDLDPLPASTTPRRLSVSSPANQVVASLDDVLVGEVWICSGQSNMQMSVNSVPDIKALLPQAVNIRSFSVKNTVAFQEQDRCEGEWTDAPPKSAVAFAFANSLQTMADVPVGVILTSWGSSSIEAWMPRDMTKTVPHFKTLMEEFDADVATQDKIRAILDGPKPWSGQDDVFLRRQSNIVFNAMMKPLVPYACRGLVWYQGERNTQSMFGMLEEPWYSRNSGMLKYGEVLKQWIVRYRKLWNRDDLHFLIVMLPGYGQGLETGPEIGAESPIAHSWAWMRESQLAALELKNTSVANTLDLGDVKNIHPKDKLPLGQRLARLALRDTLGQNVEAEGPVMSHVERRGESLVVHFDHAEGLTTKDGDPPKGFWLAGKSQEWVAADATLNGNTVELRSAELPQPLYVRYGFAGTPKVNLVNAAGLPAYPFRTDRFEP